ncbi:hypothetical protein C8A01DRAFT_45203 [Parachaetomium inaequale]|uniref:DUF7580 domain-containing protein n=1 Tax=Parachaetomium inaequale TaxID=2588326 RepID=A0AAN6ST69_9PEZI|nr:hypothetical protein C8A01DRAFT_45203 [Parachaetomium inaequale]
MSGFEVAGIVLGGFPLLLYCLDHYREGFEPLEEWWNFRTHFIGFVDDIRHQMMRYNENLVRLLDPIIADTDDIASLIRDTSLEDKRWHDGSLEGPLTQRLASEYDRFLRILGRMQELMADLERLLQIDNGKRMRISFSKGKHKKIRKLAACNQELQEILGYSERIVPIADKRKSSEPVRMFERIRQHACGVYNALKRHWRCDRSCQPDDHKAHLSLGAAAVSVSLDVIFILGDGNPDDSRPPWQQIQIVPTETAHAAVSTDVSHVQQSALLASVQQTLIQQDAAARKQNLTSTLPLSLQSMRSSLKTSLRGAGTRPSLRTDKTVQFDTQVVSVTSSLSTSCATPVNIDPQPEPQPISDLCHFLAHNEHKSGVLQSDTDRHFRMHKLPKDPEASAADRVQLVPLSELMKAYYHGLIDISRQRRFEMATHVASALLQTHTSPWLAERWSKTDVYFLVNTESGSLRSTYPLFSRSFYPVPCSTPNVEGDPADNNTNNNNPQTTVHNPGGQPPNEEERTRTSLFTVGILLLELIFGHALEDCRFRREYYGSNNQPNEQTDACTARRWARGLLGESGAEVADAVRRCLDCSFGPRPDLGDARFCEGVYEGVVRPLAEYAGAWPAVVA